VIDAESSAERTLTQEHPTDLLRAVLDGCNEAQIEYCVMRNFASLPDVLPENDIDLMLRRRDASQVERLLCSEATRLGYRLVCLMKRQYVFSYKFLRLRGKEVASSHFDLNFDLDWHGARYLAATDVLAARCFDSRGFYFAGPADEVLIALLPGLLWGGKVDDGRLARFAELEDDTWQLVANRLRAGFDETLATQVEDAMRQGDTEALKGLRKRLKNCLFHRQLRSPLGYLRWIEFAGRELAINLAQPGLVISIDGDGVADARASAQQIMEFFAEQRQPFSREFIRFDAAPANAESPMRWFRTTWGVRRKCGLLVTVAGPRRTGLADLVVESDRRVSRSTGLVGRWLRASESKRQLTATLAELLPLVLRARAADPP
jgi:hypothetical protein